jgi:hypothetical protein
MATNPNISLAVRGIELQDPLAQYGRVAAIQGAQQQNQLAQLQMRQVQREQESTNALNRAYAEAYNPQTGEIDVNRLRGSLSSGGFGSKLPGVEKGLVDLQTARTTQQKLQGEVAAQPTTLAAAQSKLLDDKLRQSRQFLETLDPSSPDAAERYMQWHRANHADPVIGKALEARGITVDQSMARIQQLLQTPGGLNRLINESKLGTDKFMEMNKPQLSTKDTGNVLIDRTFQPLTGQITEVSRTPKMMAPGEQERIDISRDQLRTSQGQLSLAQQKFKFEQANPGFELKEAEDGSIVGVNKRTLQAFPVSIGGAAPAAPGAGMPGPRMPAPATQAIPGMTSVLDQPAPAAAAPVTGTPLRGKGTALTESQGNATAYGMRMREANAILEPLEKAGKTNTGLIKGVVGGTVGLIPLLGEKLEDVSGSVFNALPRILGGLSPEQQQVAQARINFITAILRKESGAAIGANEFATAEKNYFPKPGDDAATIAQKQQARKTAIRAMEIQAGPGARQMGGGGGVPGSSATNPLGLPGL